MFAAQDSQKALNNIIDQKIFYTMYAGAYSYISAQDLGGSGTGVVAVGSSNIKNLFTVADRNLTKFNRTSGNRFAAIGPRLLEQIKLDVSNRETAFGDKVYENGLVAPRFGFDIYLTNNLYFVATFTLSGIPADGETITIDGVTFTWEAHGTACSTAGEVDLGTDEATAYANLVLAINGTTAGTTSTYCEVSDDDREILNNASITATYSTNLLTITGYGDVVCTESTQNCVLATNVQYPIFGIKGAMDFVCLKEPNVEFRTCENLLGRKIYAWTNYGVKTFTKEKKSLCYAKIDTSSWV